MSSVTILGEACKGLEDCGICVFVCPKDLFQASESMNASGYIPPELTNADQCTNCRNCMIYCPDFAIIVADESKEPETPEVAHEG